MPPKRRSIPTDVMEAQPKTVVSGMGSAGLARDTAMFSTNNNRGEKLENYMAEQTEEARSTIDYSNEYGVTGLKRQGGQIYEEFLPQLAHERATKVYKEMRDNDPTINAIAFAIEMLIRKVEWRVDAASGRPEDEEYAQFIRECMDDMSHTWADMISEIISMLWYGYSTHEIVYKVRRGPNENDSNLKSRYTDGKIGWRKIPIRSQDSLEDWIFDEEGGVAGWYQRAWPDFLLRDIPIEKALIFKTTSTKNNPEGRSVLRGAYRPWYFKKRMEEIEGIGVERDLAGIPIARVPADLFDSKDPAKMKALEGMRTLVKQVRNDEQAGIIFPLEYDEDGHELYKFELLSAGGSRAFDTNGIIKRWDERIAMVVLADFIFLGHEATGSWALATSKTGLFQSALSAWADTVAEVFNRHAIPRLFKLNNMPIDHLPKIAHEEVDAPTLEELGSFIGSMTGAGWGDILSDIDLRNVLLKRARLPVPSDETEGEDVDDTNNVLPGHTPGKENLIFAGPTGVVRVSPDGKADIQSAATAAQPQEGGEKAEASGGGEAAARASGKGSENVRQLKLGSRPGSGPRVLQREEQKAPANKTPAQTKAPTTANPKQIEKIDTITKAFKKILMDAGM